MTDLDVDIRPFSHTDANQQEYDAINRHFNRAKARTLPDDPPTPIDERIAQFHNVPSFVSVEMWAGWNAAGDEIVASGEANCLNTPENKHLMFFEIEVDPDYRRRGIGRTMLKLATEVALREERRIMMSDTNERVPSGEEFMKRIGADRGLENHTNQLTLAELDRNLLANWLVDGPHKAEGFELGYWDGPYPEEHIENVCLLDDILNDAPRGELQMNDWHATPEQLREGEKRQLAQKTQRWALYALESSSGRFAALTEVYWNPNRPDVVNQGLTGVHPEFRGKGIGRWMKATMLDRILRDRPNVKFVRTGNADSNAPMLAINHALGFKPYISRCVWQIETEKVAKYLGI